MLLHDFGNSHAVCFDLLFISFDFTVALRDLALQQSNSAQCVFLFGRKLNGRQPGFLRRYGLVIQAPVAALHRTL